MRKTLIGLAMLVVAAGLTTGAQEPVPIQKDAKTGGPDPAAQRELEDLQAAAEKAQADLTAANEQFRQLMERMETLNAEHKLQLATLEAEHKVKAATLEREVVNMNQTAARLQVKQGQIRAEINRRQSAGARGAPGGKRGGRGAPADMEQMMKALNQGKDAQPRGGNPMAATEQKLDAFMQKLAEMEARLKRLEDRRQDKNR